jgi:alpha-galactosidase
MTPHHSRTACTLVLTLASLVSIHPILAGGEIWLRTMADGTKIIGLFNRGNAPMTFNFHLADAGLSGKWLARDLWLRRDAGPVDDRLTETLPSHGAILLKLTAVKPL